MKDVSKVENSSNATINVVSKSFYCYNEKQWLDSCKYQCVSCAVEMIRTKLQ